MADIFQNSIKFLEGTLSRQPSDLCIDTRPYVTLTYAQSLDGRIAGADNEQLALSGPESFAMTHWMRKMHDGILIGVGTALNDNPGLGVTRLPDSTAELPLPRHVVPIPIILDSTLRLPLESKMISRHLRGEGKPPWVICSHQADAARRTALREKGVKVMEASTTPETGLLDVHDVLLKLRKQGVRSLMVEGGQKVISEFLGAQVVDIVIITVSPIWVGAEGLSAMCDNTKRPGLEHVGSLLCGKDTVIACRPK